MHRGPEAIAPIFHVSSAFTLFLNDRLSGDDLLQMVAVAGFTSTVVDIAAALRSQGCRSVACLPLVPGDWQGVRPQRALDQIPAVGITESGALLVPRDGVLLLEHHEGYSPAAQVGTLTHLLLESIDSLTSVFEADGILLPTSKIVSTPALELSAEFTTSARRLTQIASTMLWIDSELDRRTIPISASSSRAIEFLDEATRLARAAVAAVISDRTLRQG